MVSRDIRRAARCAHNAPNTGKRAFGPLPRGVHAAAADSKGRGLKAPSRIPESGGNANLAHSSGMKKSSEPLSEPSSGRETPSSSELPSSRPPSVEPPSSGMSGAVLGRALELMAITGALAG